MSLARKCDRCKKLFEPNLIWKGNTNAYHSISVRIENQDKVLDRLYNSDLCPECYEELRAWMEMEVEECCENVSIISDSSPCKHCIRDVASCWGCDTYFEWLDKRKDEKEE